MVGIPELAGVDEPVPVFSAGLALPFLLGVSDGFEELEFDEPVVLGFPVQKNDSSYENYNIKKYVI